MEMHGGDLKFLEHDTDYNQIENTLALYRDITSDLTDAAGHDK